MCWEIAHNFVNTYIQGRKNLIDTNIKLAVKASRFMAMLVASTSLMLCAIFVYFHKTRTNEVQAQESFILPTLLIWLSSYCLICAS